MRPRQELRTRIVAAHNHETPDRNTGRDTSGIRRRPLETPKLAAHGAVRLSHVVAQSLSIRVEYLQILVQLPGNMLYPIVGVTFHLIATRVGAFFEVKPTMSTVRRVPGTWTCRSKQHTSAAPWFL